MDPNNRAIKKEEETGGHGIWRHNPLARPASTRSSRGGRRGGRGGRRGGLGNRGSSWSEAGSFQPATRMVLVPPLFMEGSMKRGNPLVRLSLNGDISDAQADYMGCLAGVDGGALAFCASTDEAILAAVRQARTNTGSHELMGFFAAPKRQVRPDDDRWATKPVQWFPPADKLQKPEQIIKSEPSDAGERTPPRAYFSTWYAVFVLQPSHHLLNVSTESDRDFSRLAEQKSDLQPHRTPLRPKQPRTARHITNMKDVEDG